MKRLALAALATGMAVSAQAATIDLNINNETIRAEYDAPLPQNRLNMSAGVLYHEENDAADALIGHLGLHTQEDTARYSIGVGGRLYGVMVDYGRVDYDGLAIGLGAQGSFSFAQLPQMRFGGHLYYAPRVASFGDVDGMTDMSLRAYYQALKDVDLYVGWRRMDLDNRGDSDDLDSNLNFGFVMNF